MTMTGKLYGAATAVALLTGSAHAGDRIPARFVDFWCSTTTADDDDAHTRCAEAPANMRFRADGYDRLGVTCRLLNARSLDANTAMVKFRCSGYGSNRIESYVLSLDDKDMLHIADGHEGR
jgi:hypothetical protein